MPHSFFLIQPLFVLAMVIITAILISQYLRNRRKERLLMIEQGMNPYDNLDINQFNKLTNLKNGIVLLSLGVGLFIGHLLTLSFESLDDFITYLTMTLICGGIGFITAYVIINKSR